MLSDACMYKFAVWMLSTMYVLIVCLCVLLSVHLTVCAPVCVCVCVCVCVHVCFQNSKCLQLATIVMSRSQRGKWKQNRQGKAVDDWGSGLPLPQR